MSTFAGTVAVVTGATRGIGRAIALELARQGCDVAFSYRSRADLAETLTRELDALGVRSLAAQVDSQHVLFSGLTPMARLPSQMRGILRPI